MTPHNTAKKGEIAKVVLMPGDPLRAQYVAEKYLKDARLVSSVRNMLAYTGTWNGQEITIMGSGMGMPSIGIYSWELFKEYDVEAIIRIGSAGSYVPELEVFDVVLSDSAFSESTYAQVTSEDQDNLQYPSEELNAIITKNAEALNIPLHNVRVHSSDVFYHNGGNRPQQAVDAGCSVVEMESFALFHNAKALGKKAACLLTVSDSFVNPATNTTPEQRERSFGEMIRIALNTAAEVAANV